jgi:epoxyqueuosine reductase
MGDDEFRSRFRRTPLWRPRREGLLRNAVIVVTNGEHLDALPAVTALLNDDSAVLREVASWCIGRIGDSDARRSLTRALERETDPAVAELMRFDVTGGGFQLI